MITQHVDHIYGPSSWGDDVDKVIEHHDCTTCGGLVSRELDVETGAPLHELGICENGHNSQPADETEGGN